MGTSALSGTPRYPDGENNDDDEHDECGHDYHHKKHHQLDDHLQDHVLLPEPRKAFVPNGGKQLLYIRVGNKLEGNDLVSRQ